MYAATQGQTIAIALAFGPFGLIAIWACISDWRQDRRRKARKVLVAEHQAKGRCACVTCCRELYGYLGQ